MTTTTKTGFTFVSKGDPDNPRHGHWEDSDGKKVDHETMLAAAFCDRMIRPDHKLILEWQYRRLGHFRKGLLELICLADEHNADLLHKAFPHEVDTITRWKTSTLRQEIDDLYGPIT